MQGKDLVPEGGVRRAPSVTERVQVQRRGRTLSESSRGGRPDGWCGRALKDGRPARASPSRGGHREESFHGNGTGPGKPRSSRSVPSVGPSTTSTLCSLSSTPSTGAWAAAPVWKAAAQPHGREGGPVTGLVRHAKGRATVPPSGRLPGLSEHRCDLGFWGCRARGALRPRGRGWGGGCHVKRWEDLISIGGT